MTQEAIRAGSARGAWTTVFLLSLVYLCGLLDRIILSLVLGSVQKGFHISDTQAGLLAGAAFGAPFVLASIPFGWAADRFDRRTLVIFALLLWSAMTFSCGLATGFAMLFAFRMAVGVGEAAQTPCASSMIGDLFPQQRRPLAFGVYLTAGALGISLAFLMGGALVHYLGQFPHLSLPLLGETPAWRITLMSSALPGFALAVLAMALLREPIRDAGDHAPARSDQPGFLAFLGANKLVAVAIVLGIPTITTGVYTFINWMPIFFARIHGWAPGKSSVMFACTCGAAAFFGSILIGFLPRILRALRAPAPTLLACLLAGLWMNLFGGLAMIVHDAEVTLALLTLSCFGLMTTSVLALAAINEVAPPNFRARFTAVFAVGIGIITNSLGALAAGALAQHFFKSPATIDKSLLIVWGASLVIGGLLMAVGLPGYSRLVRAAPAAA